jgi:hypothetical protein
MNGAFANCSRSGIGVVFVLGLCNRPATYRGIGVALDIGYSGVRAAVASASACGLVVIKHLRKGRSTIGVVALTPKARKTLASIGVLDVQS